MGFPVLDSAIANCVAELVRDHQQKKGFVARKAEAVKASVVSLKAEEVVEQGAKQGLSQGISSATSGSAALNVASRIGNTAHALIAHGHTIVSNTVHINPVTWAAKPWIAAWDVIKVQNAKEKMYAICDEPNNAYAKKYKMKEHYACTCKSRKFVPVVEWDKDNFPVYTKKAREPGKDKTCDEIYAYFSNQKDWKAFRIATAVFTGPLYAAGATIESAAKKEVFSSDTNDAIAKNLIGNGLPEFSETVVNGDRVMKVKESGCHRAQAIIAMWLGELELADPAGGVVSYDKTIQAMIHPDGHEAITKNFSSGILLPTS